MVLLPVGTAASLFLWSGEEAWLLCVGLYLGLSAKVLIQLAAAPRVLIPLFKPPTANLRHAWVVHRMLIGEFFALIFSSVVLGLMPVIAQAYAAGLPAGSVAGLGYANKLVGVGLALLSGVINAVIFPLLAEHAARNRGHSVSPRKFVGLGLLPPGGR